MEISPNRGQNHYQVYLNRFYIGVVSYVNNQFWSFHHQVKEQATFTGAEGRIIVDIAIGKLIPKTLITAKEVKVNGERWTVIMSVPGEYEVRNQQGIVRGKLQRVIHNSRQTWASENLDPVTLDQIVLQMQSPK